MMDIQSIELVQWLVTEGLVALVGVAAIAVYAVRTDPYRA
jgi:hypothetical protein